MRYVLFVLLFHFSITINTQTLKLKETFSDSLFQKWDNTFELKNNTVLNLTCPKIDTVRIAVIGLGNRGSMALERLPQIQNVKIVAIADIDSNKVNNSLKTYFENKNLQLPHPFYEENDWKLICQRKDIDLIYVC